MKSKYNSIEVNGHWNDTKQPFYGMWVTEDTWDGVEDEHDEEIFYYMDGAPIIGDHGDFTITEIA
jgi:hypothetical protein